VRKIEVGQHYQMTSPPGTVWELLEPVLDSMKIRHFRIRQVDDPTTTKLISEHTLANERLYRLVKER
jgi:hypothetical protein